MNLIKIIQGLLKEYIFGSNYSNMYLKVHIPPKYYLNIIYVTKENEIYNEMYFYYTL